jgi:hypothetical protein
MSDIFKFGWLPDGHTEERYEYPDVWLRETTDGLDRLAIAPHTRYIELLDELAFSLQEPFWLLYVLVVPRGSSEPGRYQSENSFTFVQLKQFLSEYSSFLEKDGRHNLWIRPASGEGLLVYDRHNIIYAYGPLDGFIRILNSFELTESKEQFLRYESPHVHRYHSEFDRDEEQILSQYKWTRSSLRPGDENPD